MTTPDDRSAPAGEPVPPRWDAPPQAPAWDRPPEGPSGWGPPPAYSPAPHGAPAGDPAWAEGPGWGPQATSGKAVAALVLAIVSWVMLPFVAAVVALPLAGSAKREIVRSQGRIGGAGLVTAARIVAWANVALCLLVAAAFLLFAVAAFGLAASPA